MPPVPVLDAGRIARLRDVLAGGYLAHDDDERAAAALLALWPGIDLLVQAGNDFHRRAARWAVSGGTPGFPVPEAAGVIFGGCGYPVGGGFHQAAAAARPEAMFTYASADPAAVNYCRVLLARPEPLRVSAYQASPADPAALLGSFAARAVLDRGPVMVQLQFCCQRWPGEFCAWALGEYARRLPPGSTVALTMGIPGGTASAARITQDLGAAAGSPFYPHAEADAETWAKEAGMELAPPGVTDVLPPGVTDIRARGAGLSRRPPAARVIAAVALVP
jgi:hypothetical protein